MLTICHANVRAVHMHTGRGASGAALSLPKFWATQIFWAAREIWSKPVSKDVSMFFLLV